MSQRAFVCAVTGLICLSGLFAGCGPQADLSLKFTVGDRTRYIITDEDIKDFEFEQPSLNKVRSEPRKSISQIRFVQEIQSVDEKGAVAIITIKGLKYRAMDKGEVKFDFDSSREGDKEKPLAKLLGQSYKIKLASDGSVQVVDTDKIRKVVTGGLAFRVANGLFSNESIQKRHEILSLPDADKSLLKRGDDWTRTKTPKVRLMVPKSFEKTYTLNKVESQDGRQVAIVDMNATESPVPAKDVSKIAGGIGLFANLFDTEEDYTGQMVLDLGTGKVAKYHEKLLTRYIAAEPSGQQKQDKGPDLLTIVLTYSTSLEMLD
jgi:hypothetical protein